MSDNSTSANGNGAPANGKGPVPAVKAPAVMTPAVKAPVAKAMAPVAAKPAAPAAALTPTVSVAPKTTALVKAATPAPAIPAQPVPAQPVASVRPAVAPAPQATRGAVTPMKPTPALIEVSDEPDGVDSNFLIFHVLPSVMISGVAHAILVVILAFMYLPQVERSEIREIVSAPPEEIPEIEEFQDALQDEMKLDTSIVSDEQSDVVTPNTQNVVDSTVVADTDALDPDAAALSMDPVEMGGEAYVPVMGNKQQGSVNGTGFAGRGAKSRAAMVTRGGGTSGSEAAVARALKWFKEHQNPDGSWNFDHRTAVGGRGKDPGKMTDCKTGATAMALLPFLGAGQTHMEGEYKQTVAKGLYFLVGQMKVGKNGGDLSQGGGSLYSHGLAAIAICEAYGMTKDKSLRAPAQAAVTFTCWAQDPLGGGWRYAPQQAGDTSCVGWQLMALKSAHMSYLDVPPSSVQGAIKFLDTVQAESGAKYGYTEPGAGDATTAIGLLSRMYTGWKREHPALQRGVQFLSTMGPSKGNMYYNYYATQVMRQYDDPELWPKWNTPMRDFLVESQEKDEKNVECGSWIMKGDHGSDAGGRIYCTSMSTMILEVYYRHMPIYGKAAAEDDFPL